MNGKQLNQDQIDALNKFAKTHGRTWKSKLRTLWFNGLYRHAGIDDDQAALLQQVRNQRQSSIILDKFKAS